MFPKFNLKKAPKKSNKNSSQILNTPNSSSKKKLILRRDNYMKPENLKNEIEELSDSHPQINKKNRQDQKNFDENNSKKINGFESIELINEGQRWIGEANLNNIEELKNDKPILESTMKNTNKFIQPIKKGQIEEPKLYIETNVSRNRVPIFLPDIIKNNNNNLNNVCPEIEIEYPTFQNRGSNKLKEKFYNFNNPNLSDQIPLPNQVNPRNEISQTLNIQANVNLKCEVKEEKIQENLQMPLQNEDNVSNNNNDELKRQAFEKFIDEVCKREKEMIEKENAKQEEDLKNQNEVPSSKYSNRFDNYKIPNTSQPPDPIPGEEVFRLVKSLVERLKKEQELREKEGND